MLTTYAQQTMVDALPIGAAIFIGPELIIGAVNQQMLAIWSKESSVTGLPLADAIPEIREQGFAELLLNVYHTGNEYRNPEGKAELLNNDRPEIKHFDFSFKPLKDSDGKIYGIINTAVDTTQRVLYAEQLTATNEELQVIQEERDRLHQELAIKEERLRFAMKAAEVGTWDLDVSNNLVRWDERCKELYGFSKDDVVPYEQVLGYMHPDDMPAVNDAVRRALDPSSNGGYDIQFRTIGAEDGRVRWLHCSGKAFFGEDGRPYRFSGIAQDITATHLLQLEIENTKNNLKFAIEAANFGTWHINTDTRKLVANDRLKELFGFSKDDEVTVENCLANITDDYRDRVTNAIEQAILHGGNYDLSYTVRGNDKDALRWVRAVGSLKADENGELSAFTGVVIDITQQKQEEQRRSDFIGIVSHELRSPLTSLNGYVQMLTMKAKKAEDNFTLDVAGKAKRQVDKMSALITGFLDVARIGEGKIKLNLKPFDMAALVKLAEEESMATITTHKVVFHPVLYTPVVADQDKIEQVLVNLINNAVKYSPAGSTINVACITRDGKAHVSVTDEGMGIPGKDLPHIFDRFYRVESEQTKLTKGFGIGLFISKDIIESHGGQIGVESLEGKGSTFWFELPVALEA